MRVAVTGANSAVGVALLAHVARGDHEAVACVRSERAASALPSLPGITSRVVSYADADGLADALRGASSVVHLAGILVESPGSSYAKANVATTDAVVRAARAANVPHVVLVSVLGADPGSLNAYLRSKGEAELAVSRSGLRATILRTGILLGPGSAGAEALVRAAHEPHARLLGGGRHTLRPLDLDDLARALIAVCHGPPDGTVVLELVGPEPILHRDLVLRAAAVVGLAPSIAKVPVGVAKIAAAIRSRVRTGGITPGVIDVITAGEVVEDNADTALGIDLTPLSETLRKVMGGARPPTDA